MMFDGGISRTIDFRKTTDISLVSELEQTRCMNNAFLYLAEKSRHWDLQVTVEVTKLAIISLLLAAEIAISKAANGRCIEHLRLFDSKPKFKYIPQNALEKTLMVTLYLQEPNLYQGANETKF
jgi:hypothetical protein